MHSRREECGYKRKPLHLLRKYRGNETNTSGATRNRINLISGCISLNLYSAKDLISRYCSTDFLQCFASFSWVIFSSVHKGNRNHGREQLFSENNSFEVLPLFFAQ